MDTYSNMNKIGIDDTGEIAALGCKLHSHSTYIHLNNNILGYT